MGVFLYWAFKGIAWSDLWLITTSISPGWLLAITFTTMVTLLIRGWRWKILMQSFAPQVTIWDATAALGICYAGNLVIPRSGEALRSLSLYWTRGAHVGSLLGTVVIERFIDLFWLIALLGTSIFLMQVRISQAFPWLAQSTIIAFAGFVVVLILLVILLYNRQWTLNMIQHQIARFSQSWSKRLTHHVEAFFKGLSSIHTPSVYLKILLSSLLLNTLYILITYEAFLAFDFVDQYHLGFFDALIIMSLSSIGMLIPTQGGTGTYHFFFSQALILLYGISHAPALACATVVHGLATIFYLGLGGPLLIIQRRNYTQRNLPNKITQTP